MSKGNRVTIRKQSINQTWNIHIYTLYLWPLGPIISSKYVKKKWGHRVETVQSLKSKYDLDFWHQKSTEVLLGSRLIHVWSIIILHQKEMELSSNNGKTNCKMFNVQIWPWFVIYWPHIERGPSQAMVNTSVKYYFFIAKINGVIIWKRYKVYIPNMTLSLILWPQNQ